MTNAVTTGTGAVLLCAATRFEAAPLARRWGLRERGDGSWEGRARALPLLLRRTGMGRAGVERSLADFREPVRRVLSVGLAGALQPGMASGDLVADMRGQDLELPQAAREIAAGLGLKLHFTRILDSQSVLGAPGQKKEAGLRHRAGAVDMESAALRGWAESSGVPFLAVRAVLDGLDDELPPDAPEGEDARALLRYAWRHRGRLPLLLATGWRGRRAMDRLGRFLEAFLERL